MKIKYTINFDDFNSAIKELDIDDARLVGLEDFFRDEAIEDAIKKDLENYIAWIEIEDA